MYNNYGSVAQSGRGAILRKSSCIGSSPMGTTYAILDQLGRVNRLKICVVWVRLPQMALWGCIPIGREKTLKTSKVRVRVSSSLL